MHPHTDILKKAVEDCFRISWNQLLIRRKLGELVLPRKIFIYLNQVDLGEDPASTSSHFGLHRTTSIQHRQKVETHLLVNDSDYVNGVKAVRDRFNHLKNERYGLQGKVPEAVESR